MDDKGEDYNPCNTTCIRCFSGYKDAISETMKTFGWTGHEELIDLREDKEASVYRLRRVGEYDFGLFNRTIIHALGGDVFNIETTFIRA